MLPPTGSDDEILMEYMNYAIGGSFTSRLNMNLREDKSWSYGVRNRLADAKGQRSILVNAPVQTDKTADSIKEIIKEFGEKHLNCGCPIVYTSADSVLQIAAHEHIFALDRLYKTCEIAAEIFDELRLQRIIARPFLGCNKDDFFRTKNRKDYISPPPIETLCDKVIKSGKKCFGIGKISDILGHRGISESVSGLSDDKLFDEMLEIIKKAKP